MPPHARHGRVPAWLRAVAIASLVFGLGVGLRAHEAGTTRVAISISQDRAYDVTIVTDAASLVEKLRAVADGPAPTNLRASALRQDILTALDDFHARVSLTFDGTPASPVTTVIVDDSQDAASVPSATLHLTGRVPTGARQLVWHYGWTFTSYQLTLHDAAGTNDVLMSIDGDQASAPIDIVRLPQARPSSIDLWRAVAFGFTFVLPLGIGSILLVVSLFLCSGRPGAVVGPVALFTSAHALATLAGTRGLPGLSASTVDLVTAACIIGIALDNLNASHPHAWRVGAAAGCGLLHGQLFAGALRESGLPHAGALAVKVAGSAGVGAALLLVAGVAVLLLGAGLWREAWFRGRVAIPTSALIACATLCWTLDRLLL